MKNRHETTPTNPPKSKTNSKIPRKPFADLTNSPSIPPLHSRRRRDDHADTPFAVSTPKSNNAVSGGDGVFCRNETTTTTKLPKSITKFKSNSKIPRNPLNDLTNSPSIPSLHSTTRHDDHGDTPVADSTLKSKNADTCGDGVFCRNEMKIHHETATTKAPKSAPKSKSKFNSKIPRNSLADLTNSPSIPSLDSRARHDDHGDTPIADSTPKSKIVDPVGDDLLFPKMEISVTYRRLKATSCPPVVRIRDIKGKRILEDAIEQQQTALSVPCQKPKKKQHYIMQEAKGKPILPKDFVEKQKSYFAEVDAFELPVEEVSEDEV